MRVPLLLLLALAPSACRSQPLGALHDPLGGHLAVPAQDGAQPAPADAEASGDAATAKALAAEWAAKLTAPERLVAIRDFAAEPLAGARTRAQAPDFAAALAAGVDEPQLIAAAFVRNPAVRAAEASLRATVNQYAQVTHLDTILAQYASFQRSSRVRLGMPMAGPDAEPHFPFPGSLELKAALVGHAVEEARARYAGVVRDTVVRARTLQARYVYLGRALSVTDALLQYLAQLEESARAKHAAGTGPKGMVIQAQVEIAQQRNDRLAMARERDVVAADIATLLDLPVDSRVGEPVEPTLPTETPPAALLQRLALEHAPDLLAVRARLRRMQTMIELAEQGTYPPFSAGLSAMEGISHATGGSTKQREPFTTRPKVRPDPWFASKEAYLREAREATRAAQARSEAVRNDTALRVERGRAQLKTAAELLDLYRRVQLAQAEQAYRDVSAAYAAGEAGFLDVMESLRRWLGFQRAADGAARDVRIAHAALEGAVGHPLP